MRLRNALQRYLPAGVGVLLGILLFLPISSKFLSNIAFVLLNKTLETENNTVPSPFFESSFQLNNKNLSFFRSRALVENRNDKLPAAAAAWKQSGWSTEDVFIHASNQIDMQNLEKSFTWYEMAEILDNENELLWHNIGKICHQFPDNEPICERFIAHNGGNLFVNSDFDLGRDGWLQKSGVDITHQVESCPDLAHKKCGTMEIKPNSPSATRTSWSQCIYLKAGQTIHFSAWIKADILAGTEWRPAYFQGRINDQVRGFWQETLTGSSGWTYYEQEIALPEFDSARVCFYPATLHSTGKIWFHSASLILDHKKTLSTK